MLLVSQWLHDAVRIKRMSERGTGRTEGGISKFEKAGMNTRFSGKEKPRNHKAAGLGVKYVLY